MSDPRRSPSAERARRRALAGQKRAVAAALIASVAALGVWWVAREPASPPSGSDRQSAASPTRPLRPVTDARLFLVWGEEAGHLEAANLDPEAPLVVELALTAAMRPDATTLPTLLFRNGREPLELSAEVHGAERDRARIEVPAGHLQPGTYLFSVKTTERAALPTRRFLLMID